MSSDCSYQGSSSSCSPQSQLSSPYSSPAQEVPQRVNYGNQPYLDILVQPEEHFRFRYETEQDGTHGSLYGKSTAKTKPYPSVILVNFFGSAIIKCTLVQRNNDEQHPNELRHDNEKNAEISLEVGPTQGYEARFCGLGIIQPLKKGVSDILFKKNFEPAERHGMSAAEFKVKCDHDAKRIDMNVLRLKFSAHDIHTDREICAPVYSEPILNKKSASTNPLKICRMSRSGGRARGGEDIFLFVDKVNKNNIEVRFIEIDESNKVSWWEKGSFSLNDVHHQYGIVVKSPPYKDSHINENVSVYVELYRPSDGQTSPRLKYTYTADPLHVQSKKRKTSSYSSIGSDDGSICSNNIPTLVLKSEAMLEDISGPMHLIPKIPKPNIDVADMMAHNMHLTNENEVLTGRNLLIGQLTPELSFNSEEFRNFKVDSEEIETFLMDTDITEFARLTGLDPLNDLVPDSGIKKNVNSNLPVFQMASPKTVQAKQDQAYYTLEDGKEVKTITKELVEIIRKKQNLKHPIVKEKLERLISLQRSNGDSFLHMTLINRELSSLELVVKLISSLKLNLLNVTNNEGQTILHLAIMYDLKELVPFLITKGCNPNCIDNEGNTAVHYAVLYQQCLEPLLHAIRDNNVDCDLDVYNKDMTTALHLAATYNNAESVKLLMSFSAKHDVKDRDGRSPLHLAVYGHSLFAMKVLLEYIPQEHVNMLDGHGYSPLQIICGIQSRDTTTTMQMIKLLLESGADPLLQQCGAKSAIQIAKNNPQVYKLLKSYVANSDDIKSEPDDDEEFDSEGDVEQDVPNTLMDDLPQYKKQLSELLDRSGKWRELAARTQCEMLSNWFEKTPSPAATLLDQIKELQDLSSASLAMILKDIGENDAANIILQNTK